MLKLTMNPRKRAKRVLSYQAKLRQYGSQQGMVEIDSKAREQKEMLTDNLQALRKQESSGQYTCVDYLSMSAWQKNIYDLLKRTRSNVHHQGDSRIDEYCREQIVEWSFRVVDYFRIDREVVAVSLSFLDRFLATCQCDRSSFKLAATTTLNLAVKVLHPCKLGNLGILSDLSRGEFDMHDVVEMEAHVLHSLSWSLHPPTSISFSTLLLDYIFCDRSLKMTEADVNDLHDISSFFTELALCDYSFVMMRPSAVALACILNALEGMFGQENNFGIHVLAVARRLRLYTDQDLSGARHRLWQLYERSEECATHNNFSQSEEEKMARSGPMYVKEMEIDTVATSSPVTVAKPSNSMQTDELYCDMRVQTLENRDWSGL